MACEVMEVGVVGKGWEPAEGKRAGEEESQ